MIPAIAIEEHFVSKAQNAAGSLKGFHLEDFPPQIIKALNDMNALRLQEMDEGGITKQVISAVPTDETPGTCHSTNLELAQHVKEHPTRFAAFGSLPMVNPEAAVQELEHCISDLGFKGVMIPSQVGGQYYDTPAYRPFWKAVERLNTVVYIHPTIPTEAVAQHYGGTENYGGTNTGQFLFSTFGWGWHIEVANHILRLFSSGLFDECPKLKLVVGHLSEGLAFLHERISKGQPKFWTTGPKRSWQTVWDENLWFTTSMFSPEAFKMLLNLAKIDRIIYSVDYPFVTNRQGQEFLEWVKAKKLVNDGDFELITRENATSLLGL